MYSFAIAQPYVLIASLLLTAMVYATMNSPWVYAVAVAAIAVSAVGAFWAKRMRHHYPMVVGLACVAMAMFGLYVKANI